MPAHQFFCFYECSCYCHFVIIISFFSHLCCLWCYYCCCCSCIQSHWQFWSVFHWKFLITYIFFVSLKFWACYATGQWGRVSSEEYYFIFKYTFVAFFFVAVFRQNICALISFISFLMKYWFFAAVLTSIKP